MTALLCFTACPDAETAQRIADALVESRLAELQARIVALHPYELPEILAVEAGGLPAYLQWIAREADPFAG